MATTETRINTETVLSVEDLRTYFTTRWGTVKAVDGISFDLRRGETLAIAAKDERSRAGGALVDRQDVILLDHGFCRPRELDLRIQAA